ncbi:MAG: hypothetical protein ACLP52_27570 [Streptosporangiaceae bacterium]
MDTLLSLDRPLWADNLLAMRRRAAYGGTVGPGGSLRGLRMQPRNEKFSALFSKAGPDVAGTAAILMEFAAAPHERWADLAKRIHDTEHAGDDTTPQTYSKIILSGVLRPRLSPPQSERAGQIAPGSTGACRTDTGSGQDTGRMRTYSLSGAGFFASAAAKTSSVHHLGFWDRNYDAIIVAVIAGVAVVMIVALPKSLARWSKGRRGKWVDIKPVDGPGENIWKKIRREETRNITEPDYPA